MRLDGIILDNTSTLLLYGGKLYHEIEGDRHEMKGWIARSEESIITSMKSSSDGSYNLCTHDGELRFWGDNKNNLLGLGIHGYNKFVYYPTILPVANVLQFDCGKSHILARTTGNSVWACGDNSKGQLGVEGIKESRGMRMTNLSMKSISCWGDSSAGIDRDNMLCMWGDNSPEQMKLYTSQHQTVLVSCSYSGTIFSNGSDLVLVKQGELVRLATNFFPTLIASGLNFVASMNSDGDLMVLEQSTVTVETSVLSDEDTILAYKNMLIIGDSESYNIRTFA